jgi:hypothetical protein
MNVKLTINKLTGKKCERGHGRGTGTDTDTDIFRFTLFRFVPFAFRLFSLRFLYFSLLKPKTNGTLMYRIYR